MKFRIEFHIPDSRIEIVGSCNGSICLSDYGSISTLRNNVIVCNPIMAQYFILPKPPKMERQRYTSGYGFGYSSSTDQYKVVRFSKIYGLSEFDCDIYTSGNDDQWRSIKGTGPAPVCRPNIVFLNEALHWKGRGKSNPKLCYFDIEKEKFGNFSLPSHIGGPAWGIGVLDNCLFISDYPSSRSVETIWVMKDYGDVGSLTLQWVIEQPVNH